LNPKDIVPIHPSKNGFCFLQFSVNMLSGLISWLDIM